MREVDLAKMKFPGYILREDGTIKRPNGSTIQEPYATGQVTMRHETGSMESRPLARLVAHYFVPNPEYHKNIAFLDGHRTNCAASNLVWVDKRPKRAKNEKEALRGEIIVRYTNGTPITNIAGDLGLVYTYVSEVVREFEEILKSAPTEAHVRSLIERL